MRIDVTLPARIATSRELAADAEESGYDGVWVSEGGHDPFLQMLQVAEVTQQVTLGTAVAIAFARSPLTMAHLAYDMAFYGQGRFVLGIGSQVKPHIERRYSMPWSRPAARMREYVLALRAIWACWRGEADLDFRGEFYTHTLMTPFFAPQRHEYGPPPVYLAGVGERMTEVAGEVCDGFFVHPFTTRRYFDQVTKPALARGRASADLTHSAPFTVSGPSFVVVGRDEGELAEAVKGTKQKIAFYASTPSYRGVLDCHGLGEIQPELTRLSKEGKWSQIGDVIDDDMLDLFAVTGDPASAGRQLVERWGGLLDRVSLDTPYRVDDSTLLEVVRAARQADSP